jgi:hypothetical protein
VFGVPDSGVQRGGEPVDDALLHARLAAGSLNEPAALRVRCLRN